MNINRLSLIIAVIISFQLAAQTQKLSPSQQIDELRVKSLILESNQALIAQIEDSLEKKVAQKNEKIVTRIKELEDTLSYLNILGKILFLLIPVSFGGAILFAKNYSKDKIEKAIEFEIFKQDPRRWPIHIPASGFDDEASRLKKIGYKRLLPYKGLDATTTENLIIYKAKGDQDLTILKEFIDEKNIDDTKCGFVIYYTGKDKLNTAILYPFDNFVLTNMPATISNQIFALSRNINPVY